MIAKVFPEVPQGPTFSSEGYLRNASGPLAPKFRSLVPDVDSRQKLELASVKAELADEARRVEDHYSFESPQKEAAAKALGKAVGEAEDWYKSTENVEKIKKYLDELTEVEEVENNPNALSYERANAWADRKVAETDRKELVKIVDSWTESLRDALTAIAKKDAKRYEAAGPYKPEAPWNTLAQIDLLTMWGLSAVGLCLILGLFTPIAALGGAAYLLGFYLSMPPWPGLPEGITEGHYRYVNKNLIEMVACLALASTPNGLWIGLDALLFGWIGRGKRRRLRAEAEADLARSIDRATPQDRRKFKPR